MTAKYDQIKKKMYEKLLVFGKALGDIPVSWKKNQRSFQIEHLIKPIVELVLAFERIRFNCDLIGSYA